MNTGLCTEDSASTEQLYGGILANAMMSDEELKENRLEYITRISIVSVQYFLFLVILNVFRKDFPFFMRFTFGCMEEDSFIVEYHKLYIENAERQ